MRVFSITNLKGGVGKTSTTLALAGLLQARGFKVLAVDLDPQASLTAALGCVPERVERGTHTVFAGSHGIAAATIDVNGFALLPAAPALARAERMPERADGLGGVLAAALRAVSERYHYALVDCPPALGVLQINALAAAERLIVPVQCEHLALMGLRRLDATLAMIARTRGGKVPPRLIVPTMVDMRTRATHFALAQLRSEWGGELWRDYIPVDTALREATRLGRMPHQHMPRGRAVLAYGRLLVDLLTDGGLYRATELAQGVDVGAELGAEGLHAPAAGRVWQADTRVL